MSVDLHEEASSLAIGLKSALRDYNPTAGIHVDRNTRTVQIIIEYKPGFHRVVLGQVTLDFTHKTISAHFSTAQPDPDRDTRILKYLLVRADSLGLEVINPAEMFGISDRQAA